MDHLTSSHWWWNVAFDGIASSLLTAALAFVGIHWALRHDRRLAATAALDAECRELYSMTRQTHQHIRDAQPVWGGEEASLARSWLRHVERLVLRRDRPPEILWRLLDTIGRHVGQAGFETRDPSLLPSLVTAEEVLFEHLTDPGKLQSTRPDRVEQIIVDIRAGIAVRQIDP